MVQNISTFDSKDRQEYDIVGPVCESSDVFRVDYDMPVSKRGDIILIRSSGAYGQSMSSRYNLRDIPKSCYGSKSQGFTCF